ncbi:hypothetical protein BD626DRAFT_548044 [Schizophyllum amplum]|uniref:Uncharacterized protein n=1 Tax=Schizophyllum amplum TaxID=97359 RepID=A0A550CG76_9AGAR|nr:hypothetical protein BD626DRAFT_548044 [Auriculariopsis ampla]
MSGVDDIVSQFAALAVGAGWTEGSNRYNRERRSYIADATASGFRSNFGANEVDLKAWQRICTTVGVPNADSLGSIKECKKALKGIFVKIVDLVDAANAGRTVSKTFKSRGKLAGYTTSEEKIFPKKRAKSNPLLKHFLIVVF